MRIYGVNVPELEQGVLHLERLGIHGVALSRLFWLELCINQRHFISQLKFWNSIALDLYELKPIVLNSQLDIDFEPCPSCELSVIVTISFAQPTPSSPQLPYQTLMTLPFHLQ